MNWTKTTLIAASFMSLAVITPATAETQAERLQVAKAYLQVSMKTMDLDKVALISARPILQQIRQKQPKLFAEKGTKLRGIIKTILMQSMQTAIRQSLPKLLGELKKEGVKLR